MPRIYAICAAALWGISLISLTGCQGNKENNVQLDSTKSVHLKTPQQVEAIQNNPNIPPRIKAMMLGHSGPPQTRAKAGQAK